MATLLAPTPDRWFDVAAERWRELLIDHANCEKKAASTALSIVFAYAEDRPLVECMSRLAREELRHFEQVQRMMTTLDVPFRRMSPARYAEGMRKAMRRDDPGRLIDLLVCGALIEARSSISTPVSPHPKSGIIGCIYVLRKIAPARRRTRSGARHYKNSRRSKRSWRQSPMSSFGFTRGVRFRAGGVLRGD
jgi:tRNA isopentenyl-2-thiomethyl-A-37 hydroxylase MiaE